MRGYTADFVFIDEAARIADEVIDAFIPVIAVRRGDVWMASRKKILESLTVTELSQSISA